MKYLLSASIFFIANCFLITASAQTPDEATPAEETICTPLTADGVTKGLYGLCVAFCEAQDLADKNIPLTEEQLATLADKAPSGRVLDAYNRKRQPDDPHMPCILPEESCPCFTPDELSRIDGITSDGTRNTQQFSCRRQVIIGLEITEIFEDDGLAEGISAFTQQEQTGGNQLCRYVDKLLGIDRLLKVEEGTLTPEQFAACTQQINAECGFKGLP